jgi:hypothetical protein
MNRQYSIIYRVPSISTLFEPDDDTEQSDENSIWVLLTVEASGPNARLTRVHLKRSVKQQSVSTTCGMILRLCP